MPDHFYVYPAYLVKGSPRSMGRRVPESVAPAEVTLEEMVAAARALGYKAEAEPARQYPRRFYEYGGRMKVTKKAGTTKAGFLKKLAAEVRRRAAPAGGG